MGDFTKRDLINSCDQYTTLRQNVYQIADAYQALKELAQETGNPDLARLVKDLRDITFDGGSLEYFTKAL